MSEQISEHKSENKMGVMPIKPLIISMSLPMMISMLVQALYNVADSLFVAQVSEDALTAVTVAFPMQNLMIAVGTGTGVGINAVLSQSLGSHDTEVANKAANNGLLLTVFNYLLFVLIGVFVTGPFVSSQTSVPIIAEYADTYIRIVTICSFGCFFQLVLERLLQSTGKTILSMISQLTGAIINIILDPILIFGWFGMPFRLSKSVVGKIYFVGVPSILMVSIGSIMTYFMNILLGGFSSTAQAVFGVYFKLQSFFFMPVFGLNNGLIPVMAYNYGAKKKERIIEALRFSVFLAIVIMCVGALVMELLPAQLLLMFDASDKMLGIGIPALRIIGLHLPLAALGITFSSVFQAFSKSYYSLAVSLGRQLVILLPVAWLFSLTGVLSNVWWCFPCAEVAALIMTFAFYFRVKKTVILTL